jgi:hypothetical protein
VIAFDPEDLDWVNMNRLLYEPLTVSLTVPQMTADDLAALDRSHSSVTWPVAAPETLLTAALQRLPLSVIKERI